jgi:membrane-associated protein
VSAVQTLLALPLWIVVTLVALLPALEASMLLGVVIPAETVVLAGGVLAHAGVVPLWVVILAAVGGAAVGDQVGYTLGRRYGGRLLAHLPGRVRRSGAVERALVLLRRHGAVAVVMGRWAAGLRALVPGVAGMSGLGRRRFTSANLAGGAVWASAVAVAGDLAGASYTALERRLGLGSDALLAVTALLVLGWMVLVHRHARGTPEAGPR